MEQVIQRCNKALVVASHGEIPRFVWKTCKGVVIINVTEIGCIFSISEGDGIVIKRNDDGTWGAPSCLKFYGAAGGAVFGKADKQLFFFPMTERGLKLFTGKTKFQLGAQVGLTVGPIGREASAGFEAGDKGAGVTLSYVFSKGALVNVGINDYFIESVSDVNYYFYNKHADVMDIVMTPGTVDIPDESNVNHLRAKLSELSGSKATLSEEQQSEDKPEAGKSEDKPDEKSEAMSQDK